MKKIVLLLAITLIAVQVYAQIPEDLDARVAKLVEMTLDRTDNKLQGFDRIDRNTYELQVKGNGYIGEITIVLDSRNAILVMSDYRIFENTANARTIQRVIYNSY